MIFCFQILLNLFWHTDKEFFSARKLIRIILRPLSALSLDPKKSRPQYISAQKISTLFWCTAWVWNWKIIFRFASIHGPACFILNVLYVCPFHLLWDTKNVKDRPQCTESCNWYHTRHKAVVVLTIWHREQNKQELELFQISLEAHSATYSTLHVTTSTSAIVFEGRHN